MCRRWYRAGKVLSRPYSIAAGYQTKLAIPVVAAFVGQIQRLCADFIRAILCDRRQILLRG